MHRVFVIITALLLSTADLTARSQAPQEAASQTPSSTIKTTAQEVLLDMVFRDKKGKTVRDIRPEEIHISEDGVEQKLKFFRLLEGKMAKPMNAGAPESAPIPLDPMREIRLVTLVFQGLDADGKRYFRQAAKDILDMAPEPNLYFSVLTIDQKLQCIQPFTSDHDALLKSLDKAALWGFVQYSNQSNEIKSSLKQVISVDEPQLSGGPASGPSQSQVNDVVNWRMAKLQYDMLQAAETADREYNARADMDALLALVRAQAQLPGRKVVLYFNPSLSIPETVKEQYDNLISVANRANVSFYTVDPKGLVTGSRSIMDTNKDRTTAEVASQGREGRDFLNDAAREIRDAQMKGGVGAVTTQQARAAETAERALRSNPLLWLRDLAQQTGGATIAETNDYRAPLREAMEEVRTYYEAAYTPQISVYDGKFRKISVRVDRPGVEVHTRSGYFAVPQLKGGQQLFAYEMPLLNALNASSAPVDVDFQAAVERFNDHGAKVEYMLTMEAPLKGLTFAPQPDKKTAAVDAALLAVLKDEHGEIVEKFSKDFAVQVAQDKIDAYKAGNMVQTFRTELSPGVYTLEAVVMDRLAQKTGVKRSTVTVPQPSTKLSISDVVVVRRTEPTKDNQLLDAFYFPGGKVVPTLTDTLKGGPGNVLPFYFSVYPDRALPEPPKLTMAFYKEGQYLGAAEAPLPQAQPDGRIPYIANLPADKFTPGSYEIRVGVTQGSAKAEEKVDFRVE
jgi:VWFA-related protein